MHERCANRAPANCISTYTKTRKVDTTMLHHWIEGNCPGRYSNEKTKEISLIHSIVLCRCDRCKKSIKTYNGITGLHCRWCQMTLHNKCASQLKPECTLGPNREHIIPPSCIYPTVLVGKSRWVEEREYMMGLNLGTTESITKWKWSETRGIMC